MSPSDFPSRSEDGKAALDIFYSDFNDINFYVEDKGQENLYEEIFRKLFPQFRIARVFPLGGKAAVLRHATTADNERIAAFRAYILDRDFDYLLGRECSHAAIVLMMRRLARDAPMRQACGMRPCRLRLTLRR